MKLVILGENGSVHVQKWIRALADLHDIELHVICFHRGIEYPDVQYHFLKEYTRNKLDYLLNVPRVRKYVQAIQPHVVHAHYATSYGLLGALSGAKAYMLTGWGADIFDSPKNPIMRTILRYSFSKADALSVLSEITLREMRKHTSKPVHLIPFGVDTEKFSPVKRVENSIIRVGTIRTLSEKYGLVYVIKGFAKASMSRPNLRLEIVGDGPQRSMLEELCAELRISNRVTFHGYINQNNDFERYKSLLDSFDIFCILSIIDSETFGVAAVEAESCGIPVIATRVGGLPEVVLSEKTGILVAPKNEEETADAIARLTDNLSLRNAMGQAGRAFVTEKYDWKKNVAMMKSVYDTLAGDHQ